MPDTLSSLFSYTSVYLSWHFNKATVAALHMKIHKRNMQNTRFDVNRISVIVYFIEI